MPPCPSEFSASGGRIWAQHLGDSDNDSPYALAVDPSDDLFLGGRVVVRKRAP